MATITKGSFSLDLILFKLDADLSDEDRQCAWELYTEIATRVAVVGKRGDKSANNFDGELYAESFDSLFSFFRECRGIMRRFPVGRIKDFRQQHLGVFINRILADLIRPFLEKWKGRYMAWCSNSAEPGRSPYELQKQFPDIQELLQDWTALRLIMRRVERTLAQQYKLVPLE
jgi:hypothetical protein